MENRHGRQKFIYSFIYQQPLDVCLAFLLLLFLCWEWSVYAKHALYQATFPAPLHFINYCLNLKKAPVLPVGKHRKGGFRKSDIPYLLSTVFNLIALQCWECTQGLMWTQPLSYTPGVAFQASWLDLRILKYSSIKVSILLFLLRSFIKCFTRHKKMTAHTHDGFLFEEQIQILHPAHWLDLPLRKQRPYQKLPLRLHWALHLRT